MRYYVFFVTSFNSWSNWICPELEEIGTNIKYGSFRVQCAFTRRGLYVCVRARHTLHIRERKTVSATHEPKAANQQTDEKERATEKKNFKHK